MKYLIKNKHWEINIDYNKEKLLYLLIDRPDLINHFDDFIWKNNKEKYSRNYDFPAVVWIHGEDVWYKNNRLYRENKKPLRIYTNGTKEYYL